MIRDSEQWEWITFSDRVLHYPDVPVDGVNGTGAGTAYCGARCINTATGDHYINKGTKAAPVWKGIITA